MTLLSLENYDSIAVFDNRGSMVSSINVNEISLAILRSSSKSLLSTTLSTFIHRNLASREEGKEGKEAMPILRLGSNANLGRALASLLATKSVALYVFDNEDDGGLTPPPSATSSSSSFKELGFLQDLNYALPSLNNPSAASLGRSWSRSNSQSNHSPSSSLGSATSTSRSGSQSHQSTSQNQQQQQQSQSRPGFTSSNTNVEFARIPLARRSSSASFHGSSAGHRRQYTPNTPSSELPPPSPTKSSLALALGNPSTLKGFVSLKEVCGIFSKVGKSIPEAITQADEKA